jgi:hypothetical protein
MGRNLRIMARTAAAAAAIVMAGCGESVAPGEASYFHATVTGAVDVGYAGSGSFSIRPPGLSGPAFTLYSVGMGAAANQGFAFDAMEAPAPGDYAIGEAVGAGVVRATYWHDEGTERRLFRAESGTLRIEQSTARRTGGRLDGRVSGTFQMEATLLYVCDVVPGWPGSFLVCDPAPGDDRVHVSGSFDAGALGGDSPGLLLGDW